MKKTIFLSLLMASAMARASIQELVPQLASVDLSIQTAAQLQLMADCSHAGRPGAGAERKAICQEICTVLKKGCPAVAAIPLVRNLQRIAGEESVATLVPMLGNKDKILRDDVRQALAVNPSPEASQALLAELKKSTEPRWTAGLIVALGERGGAGTAEAIAPFLKSKDALVFAAAAKALSRLDEPGGIKALAQQRSLEKGERKAMLTAALFETGRKEIFQQLYAANEPDEVRAVALLGLVMDKGNNVAADAMASGHAGFQSAVIEAASQRKDEALCNLLAQHLGNLPPHLQAQALGVLEFSGNRKYSSVALPLLASNDGNVQAAAAQTLSKIGTADAVQALLTAGTGDAKKALGLLNDKGVDEALILAAKSGDGSRRAVAIEALALRGRVQLMDQFFAYAADSDQQVAKAGVEAIYTLGRDEDLKKAVALLLANEKSPQSRDMLKAIVAILRRSTQEEEAVAVLVGGMSGASPKGQAMILQALAQVGSDAALAPVAKAGRSNDAALRKEAVKQLGNWPNENALPALLKVAGDTTAPLPDHVLSIRGIMRLLAGQKKLDEATANQALELCRRDEEKQQILDLLDAQHGGDKKKKRKK